MALPQSNATLLSIIAGDSVTSEDWDVAESTTTGTAKWAGETEAYYIEKVRTAYNQGEGAFVTGKDVQIILPGSLFIDNNFELEVGDVFTYSINNVTHARRVMEWREPLAPRGMSIYNYAVVHLRPEPVEDSLEGN